MTVHRRFLYGGIFLIAAGGVLLVVNGASVDRDDVAAALRLWPVAVIALGVGLLLRRTRFDVAGGMLAAAMPGLLLGGVVAAAPAPPHGCGDVRPVALRTETGAFTGAAVVDLRIACGDLSVTTAPGSGWQVDVGSGSGGAPVVSASPGRLAVASATWHGPFDWAGGGDVWRVALPTAGRLDLATEIDVGRGTLDLGGAELGDVRVVVNAGKVTLDLEGASLGHLSLRANGASAAVSLPATGDFGADLAVNAGSIRICAPADLGLRIRQEGSLASHRYAGLVRSGDAWVSPNDATAVHHADVTVTANVGSVDVNPEGGCR